MRHRAFIDLLLSGACGHIDIKDLTATLNFCNPAPYFFAFISFIALTGARIIRNAERGAGLGCHCCGGDYRYSPNLAGRLHRSPLSPNSCLSVQYALPTALVILLVAHIGVENTAATW
jgi:hypothetical protein